MAIRVAWEFKDDKEALLQLAGDVPLDVYREDRLKRADRVLSVCGVGPADRGFEIGSGDGIVAKLLARHCAGIDCCDISDSFLEMARENCRGVSNLSFHKIGGHYGLDFLPSCGFAFGFALNVFIHLNPYAIASYLHEVRRLLRPGGIFLFDTCSLAEPTVALFRQHLELFQEDPANLFGLLNFNHPSQVEAIIEECGLETMDKGHLAASGWHEFVLRRP